MRNCQKWRRQGIVSLHGCNFFVFEDNWNFPIVGEKGLNEQKKLVILWWVNFFFAEKQRLKIKLQKLHTLYFMEEVWPKIFPDQFTMDIKNLPFWIFRFFFNLVYLIFQNFKKIKFLCVLYVSGPQNHYLDTWNSKITQKY